MGVFSEFLSWLRLVWKHWQVNLTGGVIIAVLFLWQSTGRAVSAAVYLGVALVTLLASTFVVWRDERKRSDEFENEASEIYADVILCWLKDNCHTVCSFTTESLVGLLELSHSQISRGLTLLRDKWKTVEQDQLGWRYSASGAIRVTPGFKRLVQRKSAVA
jgi:hypothetical protein